MLEIPVGNGKFALVDDCDFDLQLSYSWCLNNSGRPHTRINGKHQQLSRVIADRMGLPNSLQIDHENRDKLDNQRRNLRPATQSQNNANVQSRSSTGLKGVFPTPNGRYRAQINYDGKTHCLGTYDSPEDASKAYAEAAKLRHGEFASF